MARQPHETPTGLAVMQVIAEAPAPIPISRIAHLAYADRGHVSYVVRSAERAGHLTSIRHGRTGHWALTDAGRDYLAGLVSARST